MFLNESLKCYLVQNIRCYFKEPNNFRKLQPALLCDLTTRSSDLCRIFP